MKMVILAPILASGAGAVVQAIALSLLEKIGRLFKLTIQISWKLQPSNLHYLPIKFH